MSPQVAGLPCRRVAESNLIVLQLRLHDLGSPGCRVAGSLGCRVAESNLIVLQVVCLASPQVGGSLGCRVKSYSASAKVA